MDIYNLLNNGATVTLAINLDDLKKFHSLVLEDTINNLEQVISEKNSERNVSKNRAKEILDVNDSTLWRWEKRGLLKKIKVGGKVFYKMTDIQKLLTGKIS